MSCFKKNKFTDVDYTSRCIARSTNDWWWPNSIATWHQKPYSTAL